MVNNPRILVIGATGMLGHKMLEILGKKFPGNVFGAFRGNKNRLRKFNLVPENNLFSEIEVENTDAVLNLLSRIRPDFVINCIGITLRKEDNSKIEKNFRINSVFPRFLSLWCENNNSKLIHFSTDCVFDGNKGNYTENDFPTATDVYGLSKFLGESAGTNALTLRVSIIGREIFGRTELLEWFLAQKGKKIFGFSEVIYSGLTTRFLAREVARIIEKYSTLSGLYQISSVPISKYALLNLANQAFNNSVEIVKDDSKKSDKSLSCQKYILATQFVPPVWDFMISDLVADPFPYERER